MVSQVSKRYDPRAVMAKYEAYWQENNAYAKAKRHRENGKAYYFVDGPPYTSGYIHVGTAWNKILKDTIIRFRRQQGYNVRDQPGFDMHGLPIEVKVEKSLNINNKKGIEEMGIGNFVATCRQFALQFKDTMTGQFKLLGVWMDWDNPYLTIRNSYVESAWWSLQKAYQKGLLSQSERVLTWCPRCETALAEAEVEYWDEKDPSIYVKFPLVGLDNEFILIWTTTPWTLPANLAAAVHPDLEYARVKAFSQDGGEQILWMLNDLVEEVIEMSDIEGAEVLEVKVGEELAGWKYVHPLRDEIPFQKRIKGDWVHSIVPSTTVVPEYTGIVHIAPGHGPEDFEIGKEHNLPPFCPVLEDGTFSPGAGPFKGAHVKKSNNKIMRKLMSAGLLFHSGKITHRYGHCWRCKDPIIYRTTDQWFLQVTKVKNKMLEEIAAIEWTPEWAGSSRQKDWVSNTRDWCISRQRYWGIPMPIWTCECGAMKVIGSVDEMKKDGTLPPAVHVEADLPESSPLAGMDLHRPWVDNVTFPCPKCQGTMKRIPDVLDVWFDSAVSSWAQLGYPREKAEYNKWWPCKWITEAHDQTRGWFYSQLGAGVITMDEIPYRSVLMHGWALDLSGKRMSKSEGNVIDPLEIVGEYGADTLRFYLLKANAPWEDIQFNPDGVKAAHKTLNIFWNVYYFATTYMALDKFSGTKIRLSRISDHFRPEDQWVLSRLESTKESFIEHMEAYELHKACRVVEEFILVDLSRWYIRLTRDRTWTEDDKGKDDKNAAYKAMHVILLDLAKLMSPITPYISEEIYQNLDEKALTTVHMTDIMEPDGSLLKPDLERSMKIAQAIVETVLRLRQKAEIKLRWPVGNIVVQARNAEVVQAVKSLEGVLKSQTNCKNIDLVSPDEEWTGMEIEVQPKMDVIGPVYRQWGGKVAALLRYQEPRKIKEGIEKGEYELGIEGQLLKIHPNMVTFISALPEKMIEGEFDGGEIYLDMALTDELRAEGYSKEVIRRIQQMRKEMDLDVEDIIQTKISLSDEMADTLDEWKNSIAKETRTSELTFIFDEILEDEAEGFMTEWNIMGESLVISIIAPEKKEREEEEQAEETSGHLSAALQNAMQFLQARDQMTAQQQGGSPVVEISIQTGGAAPETVAVDIDPELLRQFTSIPGVDNQTAKKLYLAGINSLEVVASYSQDELVAKANISSTLAEIIHKSLRKDQSPITKTRRCHVCGAKISEDANSCNRCGSEAKPPEAPKPEEEAGGDPGSDKAKGKASPSEEEMILPDIPGVVVDKGGAQDSKVTIVVEKTDDFPPPPEDEDFDGSMAKQKKEVSKAKEPKPGRKGKPDRETKPDEKVRPDDEVGSDSKAKPKDEGKPKKDKKGKKGKKDGADKEDAEPEDGQELDEGFCYLVKDIPTAYKLFTRELKKGRPSMCVTRDYPAKIKRKYKLKGAQILWLSDVGKKDTIPPKSLEKLNLSLERFMNKEEKGIILIVGLEYLITNNSFSTVLRLFQSLRDQISVHNSTLLMPVDPSSLQGNQYKLLEREVDACI